MTWNYRIATKIIDSIRLFSVIETYYENKDDKPSSYIDTDKNILSHWEGIEDLSDTYKLVGSAFDKPILDLDNWPNEYKL